MPKKFFIKKKITIYFNLSDSNSNINLNKTIFFISIVIIKMNEIPAITLQYTFKLLK
jgi:hypothetical protein